jgi:hypothetical protein
VRAEGPSLTPTGPTLSVARRGDCRCGAAACLLAARSQTQAGGGSHCSAELQARGARLARGGIGFELGTRWRVWLSPWPPAGLCALTTPSAVLLDRLRTLSYWNLPVLAPYSNSAAGKAKLQVSGRPVDSKPCPYMTRCTRQAGDRGWPTLRIGAQAGEGRGSHVERFCLATFGDQSRSGADRATEAWVSCPASACSARKAGRETCQPRNGRMCYMP